MEVIRLFVNKKKTPSHNKAVKNVRVGAEPIRITKTLTHRLVKTNTCSKSSIKITPRPLLLPRKEYLGTKTLSEREKAMIRPGKKHMPFDLDKKSRDPDGSGRDRKGDATNEELMVIEDEPKLQLTVQETIN